MNYNWKKGFVLTLSLLLVASLFVTGLAQEEKPEIQNPDTLTVVTYGTANAMDPSFVYDTASGVPIQNVYENLLI